MLYDYECKYCEYLLEDVQQKVSDEPLLNCPNCGEDALSRIITGGAYAFVKNSDTIGGRADKNTRENKNQIEEISHKKMENKPSPKEKKPWYAKEGNATSQEINAMTKKQQAKYIMEGKKE